ncbi:CCR4-NOT transcriptional regulation complex NOT5 subunit [Arthrobacter sp. V4I6]|uniref:mucin-associated surface protein n=1 Tax=unclassified Arthrobacter TaxID=235627 RepID=UPI002789A02D|nr:MULTISPECIES: mucin-associated surface protein [unclassified Arthrobacter]MDQ0822232.1 CCR4-NOT transcriptional regulation complex NOT5 subunit [Arthrobacter sp. V1I7]MDQ0856500.1 CCR4-NOT transcriptional regulation complex NOT5 subunit [Arthrobacter sp. V4I6]
MIRRGPVQGAGILSAGRLPAGGLLAAAVLAAALAGCSAPPADLGPDAAKQLQSQVLAVTEAAAANDLAGSQKLLDELVVRLDDAATRGEVSFKRHQSIRTSIEAVRADVTAQQAAAAAAAEQEAAAQAAAKAAAEAAAAAAATPPVVTAPVQENAGKGGKAKGKDEDD